MIALGLATTFAVPAHAGAAKRNAAQPRKSAPKKSAPKKQAPRRQAPARDRGLVLNYDLAGNPFYHTTRVLSLTGR